MKPFVEAILMYACAALGHAGACWLLNNRLGQWAMRHE
jgi:hypothetical protein